MSLLFGTAGVPHSSEKGSTLAGIKRIKELGLGAMEVEWVRGVRMSDELASQVKTLSNSLNISLTAHGPYWINLNSEDELKIEKSVERVLNTARKGFKCGCKSITFHPAYYLKQDPKKVYDFVKTKLKYISDTVEKEGIDLRVSLETTGKVSQFGTVEEIVSLSSEIENIWPCIDFAHVYARSTGKINSYKDFSEILETIENALGKKGIKNMHIHLSGIAYGDTGERNHLNLQDAKIKYNEVLKALKDFKAEGIIICESPNLEVDALLLQRTYNLL